MSEEPIIPDQDYDLAEDQLACIKTIREDFSKIRTSFLIQNRDLDPKEALREVLGREQHRLPTPMSLSGPYPWRDGRVGKPIPGN